MGLAETVGKAAACAALDVSRATAAYRIFWCHVPSPSPNTILIVAITPHP